MSVEPLSDDRARKVLDRMDLMTKIREEILVHPKLDEKLKLCKTSADMPEWWIPGRHDRDLLVGVSK
jgi:chromodomain-helicase-DNA-binding protein 7